MRGVTLNLFRKKMNICIKCSNHCSKCEIIDQFNQNMYPKAGYLNLKKIYKYLGMGQEFPTFCRMAHIHNRCRYCLYSQKTSRLSLCAMRGSRFFFRGSPTLTGFFFFFFFFLVHEGRENPNSTISGSLLARHRSAIDNYTIIEFISKLVMYLITKSMLIKYLSRENVYDQEMLKPYCSATNTSFNTELMF